MRRHSHRVRVALLAQGVAWDAADDLVQEVWLRLVEQQRAGRLRTLALPGLAVAQAGWLAREARRTQARRQAIAPTTPVDSLVADVVDSHPDSDPASRVEWTDRLRAVRLSIASCPPRMQQVVLAVYGREARAHAEVAAELGLSVQRVRQILSQARVRVRQALAALDGENDT